MKKNLNFTDRSVEEFSSRYLRLYVTQSEQTSNNAASIYQFEVYGK